MSKENFTRSVYFNYTWSVFAKGWKCAMLPEGNRYASSNLGLVEQGAVNNLGKWP